MDTRILFWWRWLVVVSVAVLLFGLGMVVLPGPTRMLFNLMLFGSAAGNPAFGPQAIAYVTFVYAVLGATMFGWAVLMVFALFGPFRRGAREGWWMMAVSLAAWFVPDTAASLLWGYWPNAVLNAVLALAFAIPLAATRSAFASG